MTDAERRAVRVEVHLGRDDLSGALRQDARRGLTSSPKALPSKWFYDARGCTLFDEITRLPEYYLTRAEREILRARAAEIADATKAETLIELGSGTSEKTGLLLDALARAGTLSRFVPFDVSESALRDAAAGLAAAYPGTEIHAIVGDFERHLDVLPRGGRRLVAFLGSTVGNLTPGQRAEFFGSLAGGMEDGDALLLGTDLVKDPARLLAAYDDAAGVTAEFNRNVLHVLNRDLGADFAVERFAHVARFDEREEWMEMSLRSLERQSVRLAELDLDVRFEAGEEMRTEISAKFRKERVEAELARAGLEVAHWWTDSDGDFALSLSFRS